VSFNAGIFASVCLASRLSTTWHAFVTVTFAVEIFALWPELLRTLRTHAPRSQPILTLVLSTAVAVVMATVSPIGCLLFIILLIFISFVCPAWLIHLQPYKNNIYGPWDEAIIKHWFNLLFHHHHHHISLRLGSSRCSRHLVMVHHVHLLQCISIRRDFTKHLVIVILCLSVRCRLCFCVCYCCCRLFVDCGAFGNIYEDVDPSCMTLTLVILYFRKQLDGCVKVVIHVHLFSCLFQMFGWCLEDRVWIANGCP